MVMAVEDGTLHARCPYGSRRGLTIVPSRHQNSTDRETSLPCWWEALRHALERIIDQPKRLEVGKTVVQTGAEK